MFQETSPSPVPLLLLLLLYLNVVGLVHRNPDHQGRPSFMTICQHYLQQSSARILYWDPDDENLSPAVGVTGAPLYEAYKLHLDLQEKYKNFKRL